MVIAFMLPRFRGTVPAAVLLTVSSLLAITCERVPLLAPSGSTITLTSSNTAVPVNGTTQLIAQVIEASGTAPHSGTTVTFTTSLGTIQPSQAETDSSGRATTTFSAGNSNGTAVITAISGGAGGGATTGTGSTTTATSNNVVRIAVGSAAVGRVSINANPALLGSIGGTSFISASVYDVNGNPLPSAPVSFTTTAGSLASTTVLTDTNGMANTTLQTVVTATVTATVGSSAPAAGTGTTPTATGQTSGSVIINVSGAPTLAITAPTSASAGTPSTFTFAVTVPTGVVVRDLTVGWGDSSPLQDLGAIGSSATVQHAYANPGTYQITGTLIDTAGDRFSVNTSVVVITTPNPTVNITLPTVPAIVAYPYTASITVQVTPPSGIGIADVTVNFGNGLTSDLGGLTGSALVSTQYPGPGTYRIAVTVQDTLGRFTTGTATLVLP
jgi:adhesin/invasin